MYKFHLNCLEHSICISLDKTWNSGIPAIVLLSLHHAAVKFDANSLPAPYQRVCPIKIDSFVYLQDLQGGSCIFTPDKEK